jgi:hypothetical protein
MRRNLILGLSICLAACAGAPKPFALDADERLQLTADRSGFLMDSEGRPFTDRRFSRAIEAGHPAPRVIDVEVDPGITMGVVLVMCQELRNLRGETVIRYRGDPARTNRIACS